MSFDKCEIYFKVKAHTNLNQSVRIIGNIEHLGFWSPTAALQLTTNANEYPYWSSTTPILLPKGTRFEFKAIIFEYDTLLKWENLPNDLNRKYKVKFYKTTLNCIEGDPTIRENVIEKLVDADSFGSLRLETNRVKKKNKNNFVFDPFNVAASDDDSWDSPLKEDGSPSFSAGSNEKEFNFEMEIKSSFYSPSMEMYETNQKIANIDHGQKMKELYEQMRAQGNNRLWHFSTKYTFHDAFYGVNEDDLTIFEEQEMVYIVTFYLPIIINTNSDGSYDIKPNYSHELLALYEYCKRYQKNRFMWIGLHKQIPPRLKEEIEETLLVEHCCQAVYLNPEQLSKFKYECKNYLWCHLQKIDVTSKLEESKDFWTTYELFNYRVAEKVNSVYDKGYVLLNDYRFLLVPSLCTKQKPSMKFHYILNFPFPSAYSLFSIPFYLQIINSITLSWILSFESHDDMANFIETVQKIYGGKIVSQSGYLAIQLYGRFILLNATAQLRREYLKRHKGVKPIFNNITLQRQVSLNLDFEFSEISFLSVDPLNCVGGIESKFKAIDQLLTLNPEMIEKLKIIQIFKFNSMSNEQEQNRILKQYEDQISLINKKFAVNKYAPIEIIVNTLHDPKWIEQYYQRAHGFIDTNVDKSNNIYLRAFMEYKEGKAVIVINQDITDRFSDFPFTFSVNPFSINDITNQIRDCFDIIVNLNDKIASNLYDGKLPLNYVEEWLMKSNLSILKANLLMRNAKIFHTYVLSKCNTHDFMLAACSLNFKKPSFIDIPLKYNNASNRVFILPLEILLNNDVLELLKINKEAENDRSYKDVDPEMYEAIHKIAKSESNTVAIITKKSKVLLDSTVGNIKNIHLLAENGCFYKSTNQNLWINMSDEDFAFKNKVKRIGQNYQQRLENCKIKETESEIKIQIKSSSNLDFIEPILLTLQKEITAAVANNDRIEVVRFENCISVRPFNINKGSIVQTLLQRIFQEKGKIGFLFCIGKSASDEEIFAGIYRSMKMSQEIFTEVKHIFTCALGHRPSHASYYVNNKDEIRSLLDSF